MLNRGKAGPKLSLLRRAAFRYKNILSSSHIFLWIFVPSSYIISFCARESWRLTKGLFYTSLNPSNTTELSSNVFPSPHFRSRPPCSHHLRLPDYHHSSNQRHRSIRSRPSLQPPDSRRFIRQTHHGSNKRRPLLPPHLPRPRRHLAQI